MRGKFNGSRGPWEKGAVESTVHHGPRTSKRQIVIEAAATNPSCYKRIKITTRPPVSSPLRCCGPTVSCLGVGMQSCSYCALPVQQRRKSSGSLQAICHCRRNRRRKKKKEKKAETKSRNQQRYLCSVPKEQRESSPQQAMLLHQIYGYGNGFMCRDPFSSFHLSNHPFPPFFSLPPKTTLPHLFNQARQIPLLNPSLLSN